MGGDLDENLAFLEEGSGLASTVVVLDERDGIVACLKSSIVLSYMGVVLLNGENASILSGFLLVFGLLKAGLSVSQVVLSLLTLWSPFGEVSGGLGAVSFGLVDVSLVGGKRGVTFVSLVSKFYVVLVLLSLDVGSKIVNHPNDYVNSSL